MILVTLLTWSMSAVLAGLDHWMSSLREVLHVCRRVFFPVSLREVLALDRRTECPGVSGRNKHNDGWGEIDGVDSGAYGCCLPSYGVVFCRSSFPSLIISIGLNLTPLSRRNFRDRFGVVFSF